MRPTTLASFTIVVALTAACTSAPPAPDLDHDGSRSTVQPCGTREVTFGALKVKEAGLISLDIDVAGPCVADSDLTLRFLTPDGEELPISGTPSTYERRDRPLDGMLSAAWRVKGRVCEEEAVSAVVQGFDRSISTRWLGEPCGTNQQNTLKVSPAYP
ncbi:MAG: hypothetical protein WD050_03255 [Actinomycetota bacterium]